MHINQIKLEIEAIVPHQIHCKTRRVPVGECNCDHKELVNQLNKLVIDILKQRR